MMTEVRSVRFEDRVLVHVDDTVEVVCDCFGDGMKLSIKVVFAVDIGGEGEGGEVAYGGFVRGRVLDDLAAKVG
jgi:hypothetical protein